LWGGIDRGELGVFPTVAHAMLSIGLNHDWIRHGISCWGNCRFFAVVIASGMRCVEDVCSIGDDGSRGDN